MNHYYSHPMLKPHATGMGDIWSDLYDSAKSAVQSELDKLDDRIIAEAVGQIRQLEPVKEAEAAAIKEATAEAYKAQAMNLQAQLEKFNQQVSANVPGGWITIAVGGVAAAFFLGKMFFK